MLDLLCCRDADNDGMQAAHVQGTTLGRVRPDRRAQKYAQGVDRDMEGGRLGHSHRSRLLEKLGKAVRRGGRQRRCRDRQ